MPWGVDVIGLIHSEGAHGESDIRKFVEETFQTIVEPLIGDLTAMRSAGSSPPPIPYELIAYSLLGAQDNSYMRASWDDKYDRGDLLRTHLWLFLAIQAALSGEVDVDSRLARYEDQIQAMVARGSDLPAELLD